MPARRGGGTPRHLPLCSGFLPQHTDMYFYMLNILSGLVYRAHLYSVKLTAPTHPCAKNRLLMIRFIPALKPFAHQKKEHTRGEDFQIKSHPVKYTLQK
ncbi:hypothetical protein GN956_G9453 [Arapaima gigas]